jgi:dCTP deaminase
VCVLSDGTILTLIAQKILIVDPFDPKSLQPCTYDLHLAQNIILEPLESVLADTIEWIALPTHIRGTLAGRSSVARLFVQPHCQGGYVDPGFAGTLTLEVTNLDKVAHRFHRGDRLCQIEFQTTDVPVLHSYSGRYQGQRGPTPSRFEHGDN